MHDFFQLFFTFFRIGAGTFGGGLAMLPMLEKEVVVKNKWITQNQLYDYYAIGQSTPGIIAVNVATFTGFVRRGIAGAIVATAGIVCPALITITIIAAFFDNFSHIVWVQKALAGINVSVSVIITGSLIKIARKSCVDILTVAIAVISFLLMLLYNVQGVVIVFASSALGILVQYKKLKAEDVQAALAQSQSDAQAQTDARAQSEIHAQANEPSQAEFREEVHAEREGDAQRGAQEQTASAQKATLSDTGEGL